MSLPKLELVSLKICPFVQRAAIVLEEKKVEYEITYIDLANKPEWFKKISPFSKVPVLLVDGTPIFESAVIAEYLEDAFDPPLHPDDALERAQHRSWIEFASNLTMAQYRLLISRTEEQFLQHKEELRELLVRLTTAVSEKKTFFSADSLNIIDAAYAPVFMRFDILNGYVDLDLWPKDGRLQKWSDGLQGLESVRRSVAHDFEEAFIQFFDKEDSFLHAYFSKGDGQEKIGAVHLESSAV